jgi:hypothetical protein
MILKSELNATNKVTGTAGFGVPLLRCSFRMYKKLEIRRNKINRPETCKDTKMY